MKLDGHRLLALGPTEWIGGDLLAGNGAEFTTRANYFSAAVFTAYSDNAFDGNALGGTAARFVNESLIRKVGGSGATTIEACYDDGDGAGTTVAEVGRIDIVQLCP
ncbi:MAG TPA: hypothetical protein VJ992_03915 [Gemmatimonadales bacterium]|nr:hypothetical protein [Gemmatimonadales bacterium]